MVYFSYAFLFCLKVVKNPYFYSSTLLPVVLAESSDFLKVNIYARNNYFLAIRQVLFMSSTRFSTFELVKLSFVKFGV
jgi:hypothetical protein